MNVIAITQARMSSTRLPGKVLKTINGKELVKIHFERVSKSKLISKHILATSNKSTDDALAIFAQRNGIEFFRGDENDVLKRYIDCLANLSDVDYIVRLTADCPLIDAEVVDECIKLIMDNKLDYVSNCIEPTFPDGIDVEVFTYNSLVRAHKASTLNSDREHVTPFIWRNSNIKGRSLFRAITLKNNVDYSKVRLTVDEPQDFDLVKNLIDEFGTNKSWKLYADHVLQSKITLNSNFTRNEGYQKSLEKD
ncbi:MAG: cytidylyltransferase domain-containing protein [Bacteroidota bacterium]|jgi:spore coat polysaccharide biosynthesis protein SpsF